MKADFIFLIATILFQLRKESTADDYIQSFTKVEGTLGNYEDVIRSGEKFVALKDGVLSIFANVTLLSQTKIPSGVRALRSDRLDNILFSSNNRMGIYIPESDEIIWKILPQSYNFRGNNFEFDENNTIYTATNKGICYSKFADKNFKLLSNLSSFDNVTHLAKSRDSTLYFVQNSAKTSWVINGNTEQVFLQSSIIKSVYYVTDSLSQLSFYFVDQNCTLKLVSTFHYEINSPKVTKIMDFEKCDYYKNFMFSFKDRYTDMDVFIFTKDKIFDITRGLEKMHMLAKLNDVTINAGVMNNHYIMLATSDGLWAFKWLSDN